MLSILKETLDSISSPEFSFLIEETHDIFDKFELPDYTLEFDELLATRDNADPSSISTEIYQLSKTFQEQILKQHLIYPNSENTLDQNNQLLNCILLLEKTEYIEEVQAVCEYEEDPIEALIEIVSIVVGIPSVEAATYLESVEKSTINKIKEIMNTRASIELIEDTPEITIAKRVDRFKLFADVQNNDKPIVQKLIEQGVPQSVDFSFYCNAIQKESSDMNPSQIARELICAAFISNDVPANPRTEIAKVLDKTYNDINITTPISIQVEKQLLDFEIKNRSGVTKV